MRAAEGCAGSLRLERVEEFLRAGEGGVDLGELDDLVEDGFGALGLAGVDVELGPVEAELAGGFDVVLRKNPQSCPSGIFRSLNWSAAMQDKIRLVLDALTTEKTPFIVSDVEYTAAEGSINQIQITGTPSGTITTDWVT